MLKIEVKVSGINNLAEARYCAGMGVQYVGYNLDTASGKALPVSTIKEIQGWITGTEAVLELGESGSIAASDWENPEDLVLEIPLSRLSEFGSSKKLFIRVHEWNENALASIPVHHCLITPAADESNIEQMIESILKHTHHLVFLSWRGSVERLKAILQAHPIAGIELKGAESQAGIFEAHDLAEVIELLEADE